MSSRFKEKSKDLVLSKVGIREKIEYKYIGESIKDIQSMSSSCGCSKPSIDRQSNSVVVIYKPEPIPIHLKLIGFYTVNKSINVYYKDGTSEKLTFKTKVTE